MNPLVKVLKRFYNEGVYSQEKLQLFVKLGKITQDEFEIIIRGE